MTTDTLLFICLKAIQFHVVTFSIFLILSPFLDHNPGRIISNGLVSGMFRRHKINYWRIENSRFLCTNFSYLFLNWINAKRLRSSSIWADKIKSVPVNSVQTAPCNKCCATLSSNKATHWFVSRAIRVTSCEHISDRLLLYKVQSTDCSADHVLINRCHPHPACRCIVGGNSWAGHSILAGTCIWSEPDAQCWRWHGMAQ